MRNNKKVELKNKFTVGFPDNFRKLFFLLACCCATFGIIIHISNYIRFGESDIGIIIFLVLIVPMFLLGIIVGMKTWRLDVEEDKLKYRNFFGIKKETTFDRLNKLVRKSKDRIIIYSEDKRFGMLTSYFENLHCFYQRCEQECIEVQSKSSHPLSKWKLYIESMKSLLGIGMVAVIFLPIFLPIIITDRYFGFLRNFLLVSLEGLGLGISLTVLLIIICLPMSIKGMRLIKKQEKILGFSFNEEMENHNICSGNYQDNNWFIDVEFSRAFAFRKGYIKKISKIKREAIGGILWEATITSVNNETTKIRGSQHMFLELKEWHQDNK